MMKFTWLFLINEIWINTCFQTFVQPKKKKFWLFNTVYRETVIYSETIIIPWKSHTVTTLSCIDFSYDKHQFVLVFQDKPRSELMQL